MGAVTDKTEEVVCTGERKEDEGMVLCTGKTWNCDNRFLECLTFHPGFLHFESVTWTPGGRCSKFHCTVVCCECDRWYRVKISGCSGLI